MTCFGCAHTVTRAIHAPDATALVTADNATRTVEVTTSVPRAGLAAAPFKADYPARFIAAEPQGA